MRNTEDTGSISPGSIGGKIKKYRELRGWTQKELGIRCGFTESTADVRIAQYEINSSNEYSLLDAETKDQLMEEMKGKDFNPEVWEKKLEDIITGGAGSDS